MLKSKFFRTLKIIKSRLPSCLFACFSISSRNNETFLLSRKGALFHVQKCTQIWNKILKIKVVDKSENIHSIKMANFKKRLKSTLLVIQNAYDNIEWYPENTDLETGFKLLKNYWVFFIKHKTGFLLPKHIYIKCTLALN